MWLFSLCGLPGRFEMSTGILLISLLLTQPSSFSHCELAPLLSRHHPASTYAV